MSVGLPPNMAAKANSCQSAFVLVLTHSSSYASHSFLYKLNSKKLLKRKRFSMALCMRRRRRASVHKLCVTKRVNSANGKLHKYKYKIQTWIQILIQNTKYKMFEEEAAEQCTQSKSTALMANYTSALFITELSFIIYQLTFISFAQNSKSFKCSADDTLVHDLSLTI